jgi:hypothetical protein
MANKPVAHSSRDLFPGHGAGKGDAERSPGWRENYPEINWPGVSGLKEVKPGHFRKVYGSQPITQEYAPQPASLVEALVDNELTHEGRVYKCNRCAKDIVPVQSWRLQGTPGRYCRDCYDFHFNRGLR